MKGPPSLRISFAPSPIGVAIVVVAFLATASLAVFVPGPAWLRAAIVIAVGGQALWTLRVAALRTAKGAILDLELSPEGRAALVERSGRRHEGRVQPACYVGTWLTTLVVRTDGEHWSRTMAILPDMASAEELRRLRVLLRVIGSTSERRAQPP